MDGIEYRIVPDHYRKRVPLKHKKNHKPTTDPLLQDLLVGKTVFIEAKIQLGGPSPFRTLYSFFNSRGFRLRMHKFDDLDKDAYGGILMWAESPVNVYRCTRCERIEFVIGETKPSTSECDSKFGFHFWGLKKSA